MMSTGTAMFCDATVAAFPIDGVFSTGASEVISALIAWTPAFTAGRERGPASMKLGLKMCGRDEGGGEDVREVPGARRAVHQRHPHLGPDLRRGGRVRRVVDAGGLDPVPDRLGVVRPLAEAVDAHRDQPQVALHRGVGL